MALATIIAALWHLPMAHPLASLLTLLAGSGVAFGMAINPTQSVGSVTAGYGAGLLVQSLANALVDGANTITLTPTIPFGSGKVRVKVYNGAGTSPAVATISATATDGTNTVDIAEGYVHPASAFALSSTRWTEHIFEFLLDDGLASGNGGSSGKLIGTGATSITVTITLSGTGETASADVELCGQP